MERFNDIFENIENEVMEDTDLHCMAIVGNKERYKTLVVGDYDKIGESLYFALCEDAKLLAVFADSVRIASEVVVKDKNKL
jgi:hypothetical protein